MLFKNVSMRFKVSDPYPRLNGQIQCKWVSKINSIIYLAILSLLILHSNTLRESNFKYNFCDQQILNNF